jgi:hypothetical protein
MGVVVNDWPAMAYVYGTWGYALARARERAKSHQQKMYLYQGVLNGETVWVVSWDRKKER